MLINGWINTAGIWQAAGCLNRGLYIGKIKHLCSPDFAMSCVKCPGHTVQSVKSHHSVHDVWSDEFLSILTAAIYVVSQLSGLAAAHVTLADQLIE